MSERFEQFKIVVAIFCILNPDRFGGEDNFNKLKVLANKYSDIIDSEYIWKVISF